MCIDTVIYKLNQLGIVDHPSASDLLACKASSNILNCDTSDFHRFNNRKFVFAYGMQEDKLRVFFAHYGNPRYDYQHLHTVSEKELRRGYNYASNGSSKQKTKGYIVNNEQIDEDKVSNVEIERPSKFKQKLAPAHIDTWGKDGIEDFAFPEDDPILVDYIKAQAEERDYQAKREKFAGNAVQGVKHPYLESKGFNGKVEEYGLYVNREMNLLVVPMVSLKNYEPAPKKGTERGIKYFDHSDLRCFVTFKPYYDPAKKCFPRCANGKGGNHIYINGGYSGIKRVIICEGIATGLAALKVLNDTYTDTDSGSNKNHEHMLICTCGLPTKTQVKVIREVFKTRRITRQNCAIMIVPDYDWCKKDGEIREDNVGLNKALMMRDALSDFGASIYPMGDIQGHYKEDGSPMSDFFDLYERESKEPEKYEALCDKFAAHLDSPESEPAFDPIYSTSTRFTNINKYHKLNIPNKMDLSSFPVCFQEFINERVDGIYPECLGSYVLSQIASDIGIIGNQIYTITSSAQKDYASLFLVIVAPTSSGKSDALDRGKALAGFCSMETNDMKDRMGIKLREKDKEIKKLEKEIAKDRAYAKKKTAQGDSCLLDTSENPYDKKFKAEGERDDLQLICDRLEQCDHYLKRFTTARLFQSLQIMRSAFVEKDELVTIIAEARKEFSGSLTETCAHLIEMTDCNLKSSKIKSEVSRQAPDSAITVVSCATETSIMNCFSNENVGDGLLSRVVFSSFEPCENIRYGLVRESSRMKHIDELIFSTDYGNKIYRLFASVREDVVPECDLIPATSEHKQRLDNFKDKEISNPLYDMRARQGVKCVESKEFKEEFNRFWSKFDKVCEEVADYGGHPESFKSRGKRTFLKLACYFEMISLSDKEFDKLMIFDARDHQKRIDEIGSSLNYQDKLAKIRQAEESCPTLTLSANSAIAAESIMVYITESAKKVYPKILNKVKRSRVKAQNTPRIIMIADYVVEVMKLRNKEGKINTGGALRKDARFRMAGYTTEEVRSAIRQYISDQIIHPLQPMESAPFDVIKFTLVGCD